MWRTATESQRWRSREVLSRAEDSRLQGASGDGGDRTCGLVRAAAGGTGVRAVDRGSGEDQGQAGAKAEDRPSGCRPAAAVAAGGSLSSGVGTQYGKSRPASAAVAPTSASADADADHESVASGGHE